MNPDIEQVRRRWRSLELEAPAGAKAPGRGTPRLPHTEKQRIKVRLRAMIIMLIGVMVYYCSFVRAFHPPVWFNIYYESFMFIAILAQLWQLYLLRNMKFAEMSIIEAIDYIKRMLRLRLKIKAVLLSLAVPLIVLMIWVVGEEVEPEFFRGIVAGGIVGVVLGGLIGWRIDRRFRRDFRAMIARLEGGDD